MFTGSVATGKKVMAQAAQTLTPVSLELGGKDPMIVLADADLERAANAAASYGLNNSGQVCISVERIYVEEAVHDEFLERLTEKVTTLRQGPPGEPGTVDVGAIIFPPQIELIEAHVADAVDKGATVRHRRRARRGPGPLLRAHRAHRRRSLDALHGRGDLRPDAAGDERRRRRAGDRARQRRSVRAAGFGLDPRRGARRGARAPTRRRHGDGQRRPAQLRGARAADGRVEGLRPRLAPRPRRDPQVHQAPVADGHPGLRALARRAPLPLHRPGEPDDGGAVRGAGHERPLQRPQRATLVALCDTFIPSLDPAGGRGGSAWLLAPRRLPRRGPRGDRDRAAAGRAARRADRGAAPACWTRWPRTAWPPATPLELREQIVHGVLRLRARRRSPGSRPSAKPRRDALLRAARPGHRAATRTGMRSATRARSPRRRIARGRSRCTAPRAPRR